MRIFSLFILAIASSFSLRAQNPAWQTERIQAPNPVFSEGYGVSMATDGKYLVVGSPMTTFNGGSSNSIQRTGSVFIYERVGSSWVYTAELFATLKGVHDRFGYSVAIDNGIIAVGAYLQDENATGGARVISSGSVHIFVRDSSGAWIETQVVQPNARNVSDEFGRSVDLSDGQLVVGALTSLDLNGQNLLNNAGSAYIFELDTISGLFVEKQILNPSVRKETALFGWSVSIEKGHIIVGAPNESIPALNLQNVGAAYLFSENRFGEYVEVLRVTDANPNNGEFLGESVAITGRFMAIGHSRETLDSLGQNPLGGAGAVHVYERAPNGTWNFLQKLTPADRQNGDTFGRSVAISDNFMVVGAIYEDHDTSGLNHINNSGSTYLYRRNNSGRWSLIQKLTAGANRQQSSLFGQSVAIYDSLITSSTQEDHSGVQGAGAVYSFSKCSSLTYDSVSACGPYTWIDGVTYFESNPQATVIVSSSSGCDSVVRLVFQQLSDTAVLVTDPSLMALDSSASSYQWLACDSGFATIPGANQSVFTPVANGSYALAITTNGCTDTSECFEVQTVSIREEQPNTFIYPNPSSGKINLAPSLQIESVTIIDMSGRVVIPAHKPNGSVLNLSHLAEGVYFVIIQEQNGNYFVENVSISKTN
ncbi:T9SS type A sorting domain-containing protein [Phaeocystidibacter luteus]|nr:T9SS type A sorting domain-containing protein [Phaeocystidibacter luteus]